MRAFMIAMVCLASGAGAGLAQQDADSARAERETRAAKRQHDFDYLLGDWSFSAEDKDWGRYSGRWSAVRVNTGDATQILDEYRIIGDSGVTYFASVTLRSYNAYRDEWELVSASEWGGLRDFGTARRVGDEMHIEQTFGAATAKPQIWRIRYYDIEGDRFSWAAARSLDGGRTWVNDHMRLEARRIGPPRTLGGLAGAQPSVTVRSQGDYADLIAAKRRLVDANYRNDRDSLAAVIQDLARMARSEPLAPAAWYHEGFARWLLAASHLTDGDTAAARIALAAGYHALKRAAILRPDDADIHAMLAWTIVTSAMADPGRWPVLAPELFLHRDRAVALGPTNPRVAMMDAGMLFYSPQQTGGGHERGLARGHEALAMEVAAQLADPLAPDWGGALLYGWLANLYLQTTPPRKAEARDLAERALLLRPDFWWVREHVLPLTRP